MPFVFMAPASCSIAWKLVPVDGPTLRPRRAEITHRGDRITVAHGKQFIHQLADKACLYTWPADALDARSLEVNVASPVRQ